MLISLERPKPADAKDEAKVCEPCTNDPYYEKYPYGTRINLRNGDVKKLGLDISTIKAGSTGDITAKIIFTEVSSRESINSKGESIQDDSIEIQITDLEIIPGGSDFEDAFNEAIAEPRGKAAPVQGNSGPALQGDME